jgi:hypothetical protein
MARSRAPDPAQRRWNPRASAARAEPGRSNLQRAPRPAKEGPTAPLPPPGERPPHDQAASRSRAAQATRGVAPVTRRCASPRPPRTQQPTPPRGDRRRRRSPRQAGTSWSTRPPQTRPPAPSLATPPARQLDTRTAARQAYARPDARHDPAQRTSRDPAHPRRGQKPHELLERHRDATRDRRPELALQRLIVLRNLRPDRRDDLLDHARQTGSQQLAQRDRKITPRKGRGHTTRIPPKPGTIHARRQARPVAREHRPPTAVPLRRRLRRAALLALREQAKRAASRLGNPQLIRRRLPSGRLTAILQTSGQFRKGRGPSLSSRTPRLPVSPGDVQARVRRAFSSRRGGAARHDHRRPRIRR